MLNTNIRLMDLNSTVLDSCYAAIEEHEVLFGRVGYNPFNKKEIMEKVYQVEELEQYSKEDENENYHLISNTWKSLAEQLKQQLSLNSN